MKKHLVMALVPNMHTVSHHTWNTLNSWCATKTVILAIQVRTFDFLPLPLPNCTYVHVTQDSPQVRRTKDRIERLAVARQQQRQWILPAISTIQFDSVVVVDMDVFLPNMHAFDNAQKLLQRFDIVCANGYEYNNRGEKQVYDTFPLVLTNGKWMYKHLGKPQVHLFNHILSAQVFPVKYCFGGMTIYNTSLFKLDQCAYTSTSHRYTTTTGHRCEHLALQECLHQHNVHGTVIDPTLVLYRPTLFSRKSSESVSAHHPSTTRRSSIIARKKNAT